MRSSPASSEKPSLLELTRRPDFDARVCAIARRIGAAADEGEAVELLASAADGLGADGACFVSFVQEDALRASYRYLLACDPQWGRDYVVNRWFESDPWLTYAMNAAEPVRASELAATNTSLPPMLSAAAEAGFRSAVIVPAPAAPGFARFAALYLGSDTDGFFEAEGYEAVRVLARIVAMEFNTWWMRAIRNELAAQVKLTEAELLMLRHEELGHGSKVIAAALHTEPKTIDCRFQRLNIKLGAANRRAAVRLAKLYGLI